MTLTKADDKSHLSTSNCAKFFERLIVFNFKNHEKRIFSLPSLFCPVAHLIFFLSGKIFTLSYLIFFFFFNCRHFLPISLQFSFFHLSQAHFVHVHLYLGQKPKHRTVVAFQIQSTLALQRTELWMPWALCSQNWWANSFLYLNYNLIKCRATGGWLFNNRSFSYDSWQRESTSEKSNVTIKILLNPFVSHGAFLFVGLGFGFLVCLGFFKYHYEAALHN